MTFQHRFNNRVKQNKTKQKKEKSKAKAETLLRFGPNIFKSFDKTANEKKKQSINVE